jgi:fatty-acid desaturase
VVYLVAVAGLACILGQSVLLFVFWLWMFPAGLNVLTVRFVLWCNHVKFLGYRNHETKDISNNWWFAALIATGEGWHNNHHSDPKCPNLRQKWWEFDLGYQLIKLIRKKK